MKRKPGRPKGLPRGRLGGRPLPAEVKKLHGTFRPDKERPRLLIPAGSHTQVPPPPEDFDEAHQAAWFAHASMVNENGTYRRAYLGAFRKLVQAFVLSEKLLARIDVDGKGVASWKSSDSSYALYLSRFGLSPSDNLRIATVDRTFVAELPRTEVLTETPVPDTLKPLTWQ
jgi:hypothetical protein